MKFGSIASWLLVAAGSIAVPSSSFGNLIGPGVTASPDVINGLSGLTQLATTGPIVIDPVPGTSFNATYTEIVYRASSSAGNIFCNTCLTFEISVSNAGPGIVERVSTSSFGSGSVMTDVGSTTGGSAIVPYSVDRSANGTVVGFNFIPPGVDLAGGQTTQTLIIETNATDYVPGFVSIQDGTSGFGAGFAPINPTPEPGYMALVGAGLVGIGLLRKKKVI